MWLWVLTGMFAAASPVTLPADAAPEDWREVLSLVGLELVDDLAGPGVQILDEGAQWRVTARSSDRIRTVAVDEPGGRSAREDVAQLAASLLRTVSAPRLPALPNLELPPSLPPVGPPTASSPTPAAAVAPAPNAGSSPEPTEPTEPEPRATPAAAAAVAPVPTRSVPAPRVAPVPEPAPAVLAPAAAPVGVVASPPRSWWSAWGGAGLQLRSTVRPAVTGQAWLGRAQAHSVLALGVEGQAPASLVQLSVVRHTSEVGLWGGGWLTWHGVGVGLLPGLAARGFHESGQVVFKPVPMVGASTWVAPSRAPLRLAVRVSRDLRPLELFVGDVREQVFEPWAVALWVAVLHRPNHAQGTSER